MKYQISLLKLGYADVAHELGSMDGFDRTGSSIQSERKIRLRSFGSQALIVAIGCLLGAVMIAWAVFLVWSISRLLD
jgi:hypothetical protein